MNLTDVSFAFNRALSKSFDRKKLLLTFVVLFLCGLLFIFFQGLAVGAGSWVGISMAFIPIFLSAGLLLSMGIILIRIYHDEIKGKEVIYRNVVGKSWEMVIGASYFSIPIILSYLLLWMLTGLFVLFEHVPLIGPLFSVFLAFAPFLLNLCSIVLCVLNISLLFFVTPALAFKGISAVAISQGLMDRFKHDIFLNLFLAVIAVLPLTAVLGILIFAGFMTGGAALPTNFPLFVVMRWFFIMIPFVAILSPAVVFFFNFAAESHVLLIKDAKQQAL